MEGVVIEAGTYGARAVITAPWRDEMSSELTNAGIVELELNDGKGWRGKDLGFLRLLPNLRSLKIIDLRIRSVADIHCLHQLRELELITYCDTEIRFSAWPALEKCALHWRSNAPSVFECLSLRELFIDEYDGKDVTAFTKLVHLQALAIMNAPVESLSELRVLQSLRSLRLGRLVCLTSLAGIEGLAQLEQLEIQRCRKIMVIDQIAALSKLRTLHLNDCGEIASLKPVAQLKELQTVLFYESTNIVDGDLSPLTQLPNLSRVSFKNRRHYSHRREDFGIAFTGAKT